MRTSWNGDPKWLAPRELPAGNSPAGGICNQWKSLTGDAGWGGVLAATAANARAQPLYIIFRPGTPVLELIEEAVRLLPGTHRWQVPFSTNFTQLPSEAACRWRFVTQGSPEAESALRSGGVLMDLCSTLTAPPPSVWVETARTGRKPTANAPAAAVPPPAPPQPQRQPREEPGQYGISSPTEHVPQTRPARGSMAPPTSLRPSPRLRCHRRFPHGRRKRRWAGPVGAKSRSPQR